MFALHLSLLGGICTDREKSCGFWAADGECENNTAFMAFTCPLSCNICTFDCANKHEHCDAWARGENGTLAIYSNESACVNNADYMMSNCATSCGLCHHECVDSKKECAGFAALGECDANPLYMNVHCPVSCGTCKSACKDANGDCPSWSRDGGCVDNPNYMNSLIAGRGRTNRAETDNRETAASRYLNCPQSCGVCDEQLGCSDKNDECAAWAEKGECHGNANYMARECPSSCGLCKTVCIDHAELCKAWAADSECEENTGFMHKTCPLSCGICARIEEGSGKDEL